MDKNFDDFQIDIKTSKDLYLQHNDIVLPCRGNGAIKIGIIKNIQASCVPSQNVVIIRANDGVVNPDYLKILLESPLGLKLLNSIQRGEAIKQLSHKDITQLEIPVPDRNIQDSIVKDFIKGKQEYEEIINQAEKNWKNIKNNLYNQFS